MSTFRFKWPDDVDVFQPYTGKIVAVTTGEPGAQGAKGDPGVNLHKVVVDAKSMHNVSGTVTDVVATNGMYGRQMNANAVVSVPLPALPADWTEVEFELIWSSAAATNGQLAWVPALGPAPIGAVLAAPTSLAQTVFSISQTYFPAGSVMSTTIRASSTGTPIVIDPRQGNVLRLQFITVFGTGPIILHEVRVRNGQYHRVRVAEDFMGSWWTRPRTVVSDTGMAFSAGIKSTGQTALASSNLAVSPPTEAQVSLGIFQEDDHNNGALVIRSDKVPVTFYATHGADTLLRYRRGTTAGTLTGIEAQPEQTINMGTNEAVTYVEAHARPTQNEIHVLTRGWNGWSYLRSTNWGISWSTPRKIFEMGAQMYIASSLLADGVTLRCTAFMHPSEYVGDTTPADHDIWVFHIDLATGDVTVPGNAVAVANVLTGVGLPLTYANTQPALRKPTGRIAHVFDVSSGPTPMVLYAEKDTDDTATINSDYRLLVWNGTSWQVRVICPTGQHFGHVLGFYVGGAAFKLLDDQTVYLSREDNGVWTIEKWTTVDHGLSWTSEVLDALDQPLVRPFAIDGNTSWGEVTYYRLHRYTGYIANVWFSDLMAK